VFDEPMPAWWRDQLASLGGCTPIQDVRPDPVTGHTRLSGGGVEAFILLDGLIDVGAERPRIAKVIEGLETSIGKSRAKLDNPNFRDRAPADVIAHEEERLAEVEAELAKQQRQLAELG
jgi:valyl-tRNA synthetase